MQACSIVLLEPEEDQQLLRSELLELPPVDYSPIPLAGGPHGPPEDGEESARKPLAQSPSFSGTGSARSYDGYILAVDDEDAIREALHGFFEDEGYRVVEAADGVDALAYLRTSDERYVVLLDYTMPRMNGLEVLRAVVADPRLVTQHAFILMTANMAFPQVELAAILAKYSIPLVPKPFQLSTLLQAVENAARRLSAT